MATNTAGDVGRSLYTQQTNYLHKTIAFNSPGIATSFVVGYLPAGASVVGGGVHVVTAFNDSGTDTLDVGFIGGTTDEDGYATLLLVSAVGYIVLDELAATTNIKQSVATTVTCRYNGQNTNASAGSAEVYIFYALPT